MPAKAMLCLCNGALQSSLWVHIRRLCSRVPSCTCRLTEVCVALQLASLGLLPDAGTASSRPWQTEQRLAAGRHSSALYVMADALSDATSAL